MCLRPMIIQKASNSSAMLCLCYLYLALKLKMFQASKMVPRGAATQTAHHRRRVDQHSRAPALGSKMGHVRRESHRNGAVWTIWTSPSRDLFWEEWRIKITKNIFRSYNNSISTYLTVLAVYYHCNRSLAMNNTAVHSPCQVTRASYAHLHCDPCISNEHTIQPGASRRTQPFCTFLQSQWRSLKTSFALLVSAYHILSFKLFCQQKNRPYSTLKATWFLQDKAKDFNSTCMCTRVPQFQEACEMTWNCNANRRTNHVIKES